MAILRSRGELLPVTCAVLKDDVREDFFNAIKKKVGGRMERIASACGVTVSSLNAWAKGEKLAPYHSLQRLASEFELAMPEISELRREFQQVEETPKAKSRPQIPPPAEAPPAPEKEKKEEPPRPERSAKRSERRNRRKDPSTERPPEAGRPAQPPSSEKLTEDRAYWSGVLLARGRRDETHVRLPADRKMSQNFAATWANLTQTAFGVRPDLTLSEDRAEQTASLPAEKVAAFLDRLDFAPGTAPSSAPGAPRWAWSNEDWKKAFLKGIVDASAHFHRTPALRLEGLSEKLGQSALKMFASLELTAKREEGLIVLEGEEAVRTYYEKVGTGNPKLKDQFGAYFGARAADAEAKPATEQKAGEEQKPTARGRRRSRRRRGPRRR